jgi:hypothetical protein
VRILIAKPKGGGGGLSEEIDYEEINDDGSDSQAINDPAIEYRALGLHLGEFMWTLRLSIGDGAAINASKQLDSGENNIFWIMWLFTTIITSIVFLNFIVAEASASYTKVTDTLEQVIWQEQVSLILETEEMSD